MHRSSHALRGDCYTQRFVRVILRVLFSASGPTVDIHVCLRTSLPGLDFGILTTPPTGTAATRPVRVTRAELSNHPLEALPSRRYLSRR